MSFSPENLLNELNRRDIITWAVELKNGKESLEFLTHALKEGTLNINQTANALHALFKIRHHGSIADIFQIFLFVSEHPDEKVKSEAVKLAVGLVKLTRSSENTPMEVSDDQLAILRRALESGRLTPRAAQLAREFITLEMVQEVPVPSKLLLIRCEKGHLFSGAACPWDGWSHPELAHLTELIEKFKADEIPLSIQGLADTGVDKSVLKRIVLIEIGDNECLLQGINPRQIVLNGRVQECG